MTTQYTSEIENDNGQEPTEDRLVKVGRAIVLLAAALTLGYVSLVLLFLGSVALTGCFLSCSDPDYVFGLLAAAGLSVSLAAMVTAGAAAFVRIDVKRFALRAWAYTGALVAVGSVLLVASP